MKRSALAAGVRHLRGVAAAQHHREDSDEQLLHAFAVDRDDSAFDVLVRRHGPMVLHVCRRVLEHQQDAEDAFQATFLVLARNAADLRKKSALASFLHGTAYRLALSAKRSAARRRKHESQTPPRSSVDPLEELSWREVRTLLDEEIARLPEIYRSVFVLCSLENLSRAEAAQRLDVNENTVSSRLAEARKRLSRRLARRGVELTALLGAAALATQPATAALPMTLLTSTTKAALAAAAGEALAGMVSAPVVELVQSAASAVVLGKTKMAMVILLAASALAAATSGVVVKLAGLASEPLAATPREPPSERRNPPRPPAQAEAKDTIVVRGRVLGPDGKSVAGAKVYYHFITYQEEPLPVRTTTDAHGRFTFALSPKDIPLSAEADKNDPRKVGHIVVKADGFTFAWRWHILVKQQTDLTLNVSADDTPLTGRIIDLQGKPLAELRVTAWSIAAPEKGDLTPFVKALRSRESFFDALGKHVPNYLHNPFNWRPRVPLLPTTTTDANGRFRLHGFAKDQLVELRIEGPAIATQNVFVMTRPAPREAGSSLSAPRIKDYRPSEPVVALENGFDHPVPPGLTVAGTVRDAETKQPIPRAIVESYVLAGTKLAQNTLYHTVADDQGRYRFTGLPRGKGNRIRIRPPADQPYVPAVKDVPAVKLFAEATVDVALSRGIWVDVTVADKTTGRPVPGSVSYFVFPEKPSPDNPFAQPFRDEYNNFMAIRNDGTFRFVAVPRRAILAFRTDDEKYPIAREAATIHFPFGLSASNFQAFAEINPKPGEGPVKVKFVLDAERIVKGKLLDPQGRPLPGALAAGLRHDWYWQAHQPLKTADFTALGLHPDRPRLLCFVHEERKLAGSVVVRGDEKSPVVVKLEPWATVSGRLLGADGKPIANADLWFTEVPVRKPGQPMSLDTGLHVVTHFAGKPNLDPRTDEQGRFRIERLVPGLKYNLALMDARGATRFEQIKWQGLVFAKLILKAGDSKELGDVKLQPFPIRDRPGAGETPATPPPSAPPAAAKDKEREKSVAIRGRVLDPDGKPAANTRVYVDRQTPDEKPMASATTAKDGRFSLTLARSALMVPKMNIPLRNVRLVAMAKGYGLDWLNVPLADLGKEATLRLVKDDVPIQGRVLSLEGKPLAGIKVSVKAIRAFPKDDLSRALQAERKGTQIVDSTDVRMLWYRHHMPDPSRMATTDVDGRFHLDGLGRERMVTLNVEGPGIHYGQVQTMTRRGESVRSPYKYAHYGATFDYLAKPSRLIRGTVREKGTGKPLAGIRIDDMGFTDYVTAHAETDERGRYELLGCPKGDRYGLMAQPIHDQPYLLSSVAVKDTPGFEPLTADLEMVRGIACEGRILDGETGQAVPGNIGYYPLDPNPNVTGNLGLGGALRGSRFASYGPFSNAEVQADGSFRCVVLPGRGCLVFRAEEANRYVLACVDPKTAKVGGDKMGLIALSGEARPVFLFQEQFQAIQLIDVAKDTKKVSYVIRVAVARQVTGSVVDADDKPVAGVRVKGLKRWEWKTLATEKFSVYGVNPLRPRRLYFVHAARRQIATVEVKGTETKPLTIRLQPWAAVRGRLVDADGQPLRNAELHASGFLPENGRTDGEGRFRLEGLIPGLRYDFTYEKRKSPTSGTLMIKGVVGKPGEVRDLGDVRGKPQQ